MNAADPRQAYRDAMTLTALDFRVEWLCEFPNHVQAHDPDELAAFWTIGRACPACERHAPPVTGGLVCASGLAIMRAAPDPWTHSCGRHTAPLDWWIPFVVPLHYGLATHRCRHCGATYTHRAFPGAQPLLRATWLNHHHHEENR